MSGYIIWCFFCISVCGLFTMATLTVYSVVPELKNFKGCLLRQYLTSYFAYCVMTTVAFFLNSKLLREPIAMQNIYGTALIYFGTASALWLNVISFDIWRTFRKMLPNRGAYSEVNERANFIRYSIYAWGIPVIFAIFNGYLNFIATGGPNDSLEHKIRFYPKVAESLVLIIVATCNTYFYISTALSINKINKQTAHMANRHHAEHEQWFNLYVKLFILMGVRTTSWIFLPSVDHKEYHIIFAGLEVLDSICVFLIFVWKDDVKRSFRKQFFELTSKLRIILIRHHRTCNVENGNENP